MGSKSALEPAVRRVLRERGTGCAPVSVLTATTMMLFWACAMNRSRLMPFSATRRTYAHRRDIGVAADGSLPHGMCKKRYTLTTWDGMQVPVCDPSLCDALPPVMQAPAKGSPSGARRWLPENDETYAAALPDVVGWLVDNQVRYVKYVKTFSAFPHSIGIYGAVGEIGVHHGKFFAPLAGNAAAKEPLVAIDLFEAQTENYDLSGSGNMDNILYPEKLMALMDKVGIPRNDVNLVSGNSLTLTAANFTNAQKLPAWRMLSVDGGHSLETTLHDMNVAACTVRDGGIVIIDDWLNGEWTGVQEAAIHLANAMARLVPFMHGSNKMWFTTPSHAAVYGDVARREFGCVGVHASRSIIGGVKMCMLAT